LTPPVGSANQVQYSGGDVEVWQAVPLGRCFWSSLVISTGESALTLACAVPAGYAPARYRFPGCSLVPAILVAQMFSPVAAIITLFTLVSAYKQLNTYASMIATSAAFALARPAPPCTPSSWPATACSGCRAAAGVRRRAGHRRRLDRRDR
jgi:ABC-type Fe3+ transport system permease subunit